MIMGCPEAKLDWREGSRVVSCGERQIVRARRARQAVEATARPRTASRPRSTLPPGFSEKVILECVVLFLQHIGHAPTRYS